MKMKKEVTVSVSVVNKNIQRRSCRKCVKWTDENGTYFSEKALGYFECSTWLKVFLEADSETELSAPHCASYTATPQYAFMLLCSD
jgi:hypothetical protein